MQSVTSSAAWRVEKGDGQYPTAEGRLDFLANTCHVWAEDGPGLQKLALGWRPGKLEYPAPALDEVRRRMGGASRADRPEGVGGRPARRPLRGATRELRVGAEASVSSGVGEEFVGPGAGGVHRAASCGP